MAALPLPKYGIDKLYVFPIYQTREQYQQATGQAPPPFDPKRNPKCWFDPAAKQATGRAVLYPYVLAMGDQNQALADKNGNPYQEPMILTKEEASTVNIADKLSANEPGTDQPGIPVPMRALDPDEELIFDIFGIVMVRNKTLIEANAPVGFTPDDRVILKAIAAKLNVPLT